MKRRDAKFTAFTFFALVVLSVCTSGSVAIAQENQKNPQDDNQPAKFIEVDYSKVERKIGKEPKYIGQPLYAMLILDNEAKVKVWAVLDRSNVKSKLYDILYFDKNANGDLTDKDDRIKVKEVNDRYIKFTIGDFKVPVTDVVHKDLMLMVFPADNGPDGMQMYFTLKWKGKEYVIAGCNPKDGNSICFGHSIDKAPILRPAPEGLQVLRLLEPRMKDLGKVTFNKDGVIVCKIGTTITPFIWIGKPGSCEDAFCFVSDKFLDPKKDKLFATVIGKGKDGNEFKKRYELKEHC